MKVPSQPLGALNLHYFQLLVHPVGWANVSPRKADCQHSLVSILPSDQTPPDFSLLSSYTFKPFSNLVIYITHSHHLLDVRSRNSWGCCELYRSSASGQRDTQGCRLLAAELRDEEGVQQIEKGGKLPIDPMSNSSNSVSDPHD